MKYKIKLLFSGGAMLLCMTAIAQPKDRSLTGTVYEKTGKNERQVLPGAIVAVPGTGMGTQTSADGIFKLTIPDSTDKVVVSYIGYDPDTVLLRAQDSHINVVLKAPRKLNEVVIKQHMNTTRVGLMKPMKMEEIGKGELLRAACCNLSESFETTPSVDVAFTDAVTGYKQVQMLGLAGPYTLITRENIPDVRGLAAITGLTYTPGIWIESMQLSKGTGSVVNGYESVAGQINVELLKPFNDEKLLLNVYQNAQGRSEANFYGRKEFNKKLSSNLFANVSSQWLKTDQNGDGFLDRPLNKQYLLLNRWFYHGPKGLELQAGVKGIYNTNTGGQWNYSKGAEQVAGKPWGFELNTRRAEGWAKIGKIFPDKPATSVGLQLSGIYHDQDALYGLRAYNATQKSLYANLIFQSIIDNTNHVIKAGLSSVLDDYNEQFETLRLRRTEIVPGAFAEYTYNYLDKFNVVAGLRGDYDNLYGAFLTPRLHIRYAPFSKTAIRASIGRAQRTANILAENMGYMASNRIFHIPVAGNNYDLKPEVAWNMGLNLTQKFMLDYRDGSFGIDYYYTHFQNQVVADVEMPGQVSFYNLEGSSYAHSLQAQLDYELIHNLDIRLAYRWYDVRVSYAGVLKQKPLLPAHRAFANLAYETKNNWKFNYTVQWTGPKRVPASYSSAGYYSPAFWLMNAQITKSFKSGIDVYAGAENLSNYMQPDPIISAADPYAKDFDASMIWGPIMGRNIYGGIRYTLK